MEELEVDRSHFVHFQKMAEHYLVNSHLGLLDNQIGKKVVLLEDETLTSVVPLVSDLVASWNRWTKSLVRSCSDLLSLASY